MKSALIHVTELHKSFGGTKAVDGVSLSVTKGEFVSFLGPSGSGKTTTLMMLAGFERPDSGRVVLAGKDVTDVQSWKRNIGFVFQNYALFPHMTVRKNIDFPLTVRKHDRAYIDRKTKELIDLVGLTAFADRYPAQLSGGQQQRVALARGLVFAPDVMLLDEPLGALDKNLREQMQEEIKRIQREVGITMIYVTHDQSEAMSMSDRVVLFNKGRIEQAGLPLDMYDQPRTRFVAEFLGSSNLFPLSRVDQGAGLVESSVLGRVAVGRFNSEGGGQRLLLLRPEEIVVEEAPADGQGWANAVSVEVKSLVAFGSDSIVSGRVLGSETPIKARVPHQHGRIVPRDGVVRFCWSASAGFVI